MSVMSELTSNVLQTTFETIDPAIIRKAKNRLIDVVGCIIGGANAPGNGAVHDLVKAWGGAEEATILVHGDKVPAQHAALVNCIMSRSYDFEPTGPLVDGKSTPAHLSGTTISTAITVAEQMGASGKELLTALVVGEDFASRVIAASNMNIDSGFDSTGTANAFGATAITGRLWKLDAEQLKNAFGIVLNQFAGTFQNIFDGSHCFKLPQGLSAQAGIFAVALAARGFTGVRDALLSRYGYFELYTKNPTLDALTKDLGTAFYADNTIKPYPGCRSNHAAIECVLDIVRNNTVEPDDIEEIIVEITPKTLDFAVGQHFKIREVPQIDASFSLQYNVANVLLRGDIKLEHFTDAFVCDPKIMDIVHKIRLTASFPPEKLLGSGVTIKTRSGEEFERRIDMPKGNGILTPLSPLEIQQKFFDNVAFSKTISLEKAQDALTLLDNIEEVEHVGSLINHLVS